MQQARFLAQTLLDQIALPRRPLYSDTAQLVRWHEGQELTPHADNIEPDGHPNATPHRAFSSLIYLNDDYDGGETYFPGYGVRLAPSAGALVLFGAGPQYVHGVTRVTRGQRYTYAGWFTFDKDREDNNAMRVF
ncbi:MAG TPA: 2OG-Fe(II) oxygenase [Rhizomicrobium sp.]|nr:2OG-Fe(II) oxygenase [Rhizomicrobium sp.]